MLDNAHRVLAIKSLIRKWSAKSDWDNEQSKGSRGPAPLYSHMSLRVCWGIVCPLNWDCVQLKWHSTDLDRSQLTVWSKGAARCSLNTQSHSHAYSHTRSACGENPALSERRKQRWRLIERPIYRKERTDPAGAQEGLTSAVFFFSRKSWPRISLCKSVCLNEQGQCILILFTSEPGPTKILSIYECQGVSTHLRVLKWTKW